MTEAKGTGVSVFYVLGTARGGTGILGRILSKLKGGVHAGELRKFWSKNVDEWRTCHCGKTHVDCPVLSKLLEPGKSYTSPSLDALRQVQSAASPIAHSWWTALKILYRRWRHQLRPEETQYVSVYSDLYQAFAEATGASIVAENSKNPADAALLVDADAVRVYLAVIVRDPRGVLYSTRKRSTPQNPGRARPLKTIRIALWWMIRHLSFQAIRSTYGKQRSFTVIYEQLMEDPNVALQAAGTLLGEPVRVETVEPGQPLSLPEVHGPDGAERFKATEVTLTKELQWQTMLHPIDRILMTAMTLPFLIYYGYPIRSQQSAQHTSSSKLTSDERATEYQ